MVLHNNLVEKPREEDKVPNISYDRARTCTTVGLSFYNKLGGGMALEFE